MQISTKEIVSPLMLSEREQLDSPQRPRIPTCRQLCLYGSPRPQLIIFEIDPNAQLSPYTKSYIRCVFKTSLDLGPLFRPLSTDPEIQAELGNIAFGGQFCSAGWAAAMFGIYLIYLICLNNCLGNTKAWGHQLARKWKQGISWPTIWRPLGLPPSVSSAVLC